MSGQLLDDRDRGTRGRFHPNLLLSRDGESLPVVYSVRSLQNREAEDRIIDVRHDSCDES